MNNRDSEKLIREHLSHFPRKRVFASGKEAVWLRVQNHIRDQEVTRQEESPNPGWMSLPRFRFSRMVAVVLLGIVALSLVGSAASAAKGSLPGQTLYPVKRAVEKVEIALATSDKKKVEVLSNHAKTRLAEVTVLVQEKKNIQIVADTLEDLRSTTERVIVTASSNSRPGLLADAESLVTEQERLLATVEEGAEGEVKEAVQKAIDISRESLTVVKNKQKNQEEIEGATTTGATFTPSTTSNTGAGEDGRIDSSIQLHGVTPGSEPTAEPETTEPVILPEPTKEF